jgi:subtilisin family serine protease
MALKINDFTTEALVNAIKFAGKNKAQIINASWGGYGTDSLLETAIEKFPGLFIAAAGNAGGDASYVMPCNLPYDHVICVGATDQNDQLTPWSNWGDTVDIAAPGNNILSTVPKTNFMAESFEQREHLPIIFKPSPNSAWSLRDLSFANLGLNADYGIQLGKVLFADQSYPYSANANTTLTSKTFNLSDAKVAEISFITGCDTQFDTQDWRDYMVLEATANGVTWQEIQRWDKASLGGIAKDKYIVKGYHGFFDSSVFSKNFRFRFRWVTDADNNNYGGCFIDNLSFSSYDKGGSGTYDYMSGTSMATPYVSAEAALIWATRANLNRYAIRDIILTSGDNIDSLNVKSKQRINAAAALKSLNDKKSPELVTAFGNGKANYETILPQKSVDIVFSEALNRESRQAIESAITTALKKSKFNGDSFFSWNNQLNTLTLKNISEDNEAVMVFTDDITLTVADLLGNNSATMISIVDVR